MVRPQKGTDTRLSGGCEQFPASLTDVNKLADIVAQSSAVVYCAGSVRGRNAADFSEANIDGVSAMLEALERVEKKPPLLLLSSLAASRPQLSDYAFSKHQGEQLLVGKPSLAWTIIRPPAVYGPGDREMLPLLKMARRGLVFHAGPREQRLSLLHVADLARAVTAWLRDPEKHLHKTYAIDDGTTNGYCWDDIAAAVCEGTPRILKIPRLLLESAAGANLLFSGLLGYAPMLTPGKVCELVQPEWVCANDEFTAASGWQPQLDLQQGAEQLFNPEK